MAYYQLFIINFKFFTVDPFNTIDFVHFEVVFHFPVFWCQLFDTCSDGLFLNFTNNVVIKSPIGAEHGIPVVHIDFVVHINLM